MDPGKAHGCFKGPKKAACYSNIRYPYIKCLHVGCMGIVPASNCINLGVSEFRQPEGHALPVKVGFLSMEGIDFKQALLQSLWVRLYFFLLRQENQTSKWVSDSWFVFPIARIRTVVDFASAPQHRHT